jgi:hypothetical protein
MVILGNVENQAQFGGLDAEGALPVAENGLGVEDAGQQRGHRQGQ